MLHRSAIAFAASCAALTLAACASDKKAEATKPQSAAASMPPKDAEGWRKRQEAFRHEWKEVQAKYPNVANAFRMQESIAIRALAHDSLENGPAVTYTRALPYDISILAARLQARLALLSGGSATTTINPPPCAWRQSTGPDDLERAIEDEMKCIESAP